jgi:hypothetical protein
MEQGTNPEATTTTPLPFPKAGEFTLAGVAEEDRKLAFHPPLQVNWWVLEEESTPERVTIDLLLDNGMNWKCGFSRNSTHPGSSLAPSENGGQASALDLETSIRKMLAFEFIHSFFHIKCDPNYGLLNWALSGNFRERTTMTEWTPKPGDIEGAGEAS